MAIFPTVSGANLEGRKFDLPKDFEGELNIVFVPFLQWQQRWVDGWLPFAKSLVAASPKVRAYELPTIRKMSVIEQWWLDNGMRAGIPDRKTREVTITLYLDKDAFRKALAMPTEDTIYVLVVKRDGTIVWRGDGEFAEAKGKALRQAVLG